MSYTNRDNSTVYIHTVATQYPHNIHTISTGVLPKIAPHLTRGGGGSEAGEAHYHRHEANELGRSDSKLVMEGNRRVRDILGPRATTCYDVCFSQILFHNWLQYSECKISSTLVLVTLRSGRAGWF